MNLIPLINNDLENWTKKIATTMSEELSCIEKAVQILVPLFLHQLAKNSENQSVLNVILTPNTESKYLLGELFSSRKNYIIGSISEFSGIKENHASQLFEGVFDGTIGFISRYRFQNSLPPKSVSKLLAKQRLYFLDYFPKGFNPSNIIDAKDLDFSNISISEFDNNQSTENEEETRPMDNYQLYLLGEIVKWVIPLLVLLASGWHVWQEYKDTYIIDNQKKTPTDNSPTLKGDSIIIPKTLGEENENMRNED